MSLKKFSPKDPQEAILYSFDYSNVIPDPTENIVYTDWSIAVSVGTDPNVQTMLTGESGVVGKVVTILISGGVDQCDYVITCIVDTNKNQDIKASAILQVRVQE